MSPAMGVFVLIRHCHSARTSAVVAEGLASRLEGKPLKVADHVLNPSARLSRLAHISALPRNT